MPKDIDTVKDLYEEILKVTTPNERDHHVSDFYVKCTPAVANLIFRYKYSSAVTRFRDATDPNRSLWYDIPFAYLPYWEEIERRDAQ